MSTTSLSATLDHLRIFLPAYLAIWIGGLAYFLWMPYHGELVVSMQAWRDMPWGVAVIWLTKLGEYPMVLVALIVIGWKKRELLIPTVLTFIVMGLLVSALKEFFNAPRPMELLEGAYNLNPVRGYTPNNWKSFPSGHTSMAFSGVTCILLTYRSRWLQVALLLLALLIGLSRVFLAEHFLLDILCGSFIGVATAVLIFWGYRAFRQKRKSPELLVKSH